MLHSVMRGRAFVLLALILPSLAWAGTLMGRVVGITDGDTLTLLVYRHLQVKIGLQGIDAPEMKQPFGKASKENLSRLAFSKDARADCAKEDRYGRPVCKVWVQPADCPSCGLTLDVNHAQILAGMAWWSRKYAKEQTAEDRGRYESAEEEARLRRWGLWQESNPVPPWEWRRAQKNR